MIDPTQIDLTKLGVFTTTPSLKSDKKKVIIILIGAAIVTLVGGAIYLNQNLKKNEN